MQVQENVAVKTSTTFELRTHKLGMYSLLAIIVLTLAVPMIIWLALGVVPPWQNLLNGILSVSTFMIPLSIVEIMAFYPTLGNSGMYLAYATGNISNLKLPCAAIGMEVAEVKPSTVEGDIIATISMAGSVIVCELMLVLGVILLVPLSKTLNSPILQPAFEQILPALFGALGAYYILKGWRLAVVPLGTGIIFSLIGGLPTAITVPMCVGISILGARVLYKRGWV